MKFLFLLCPIASELAQTPGQSVVPDPSECPEKTARTPQSSSKYMMLWGTKAEWTGSSLCCSSSLQMLKYSGQFNVVGWICMVFWSLVCCILYSVLLVQRKWTSHSSVAVTHDNSCSTQMIGLELMSWTDVLSTKWVVSGIVCMFMCSFCCGLTWQASKALHIHLFTPPQWDGEEKLKPVGCVKDN